MNYTDAQHEKALNQMWSDMNMKQDHHRRINWEGVFTAFLIGVLAGLVTIGVAAWMW